MIIQGRWLRLVIFEFSIRLKKLRQAKNLSQDQLAGLLSIDRSTVSAYEQSSRQPPLETLLRIADVFGTTTDYLLGRSNTHTLDLYDLEGEEALELRTLATILAEKNKIIQQLQKRCGE